MLRVKEICKRQGITLKELAERMGVPPESITRTLSSTGNPTLSTLINIARALGVEVYELFEEFEAANAVKGFLESAGTTYPIHNFADLEEVYICLKSKQNNK